MKKSRVMVILLVLVLMSTLILTACGGSTPSTTAPPTTSKPATAATATTTTPPPTTSVPIPATTKPADVIKLKFAYDSPKGKGVAAGWDYWAQEVEKRTQGRIKVEVYPGATLFAMTATIDSVAKGVADVSEASIGTFQSNFPLTNIMTLPCLGFKDTANGNVYAGETFMTLYEKYPEIKAEWKNLKLLYYSQLLNYIVVSGKQVRKPEDFKGLRVGGTGTPLDFAKSLGSAVVRQPAPDAYMNIDKGVVDASFLSWSAIADYNVAEVGKFFLDYGFGAGGTMVIMNLDAWNKIPAGDQKIIMDISNDARRVSTDAIMVSVGQAKEAAKKPGRTIVSLTSDEVSAWQKAAQGLWTDWISQQKAQGRTGAQQIFDDLKQLVDKSPQ